MVVDLRELRQTDHQSSHEGRVTEELQICLKHNHKQLLKGLVKSVNLSNLAGLSITKLNKQLAQTSYHGQIKA